MYIRTTYKLKGMDHVNWGIIGCGDVTEVKSGPAFNKAPNSKLVAVMRRNAEKAADYARRHNVEKWYSDAIDLIEDPDVNAIYVATPPSSHLQYTLAALERGKPVYVEKPMAMNVSEAREMTAFAKSKNVKLSVAHYRRQLPLFKKVKSLIDANLIGEVRFIDLKLLQSSTAGLIANTEENWRVDPQISGGGLFHDLAPHQIDIILHIFGKAQNWNGYSFNQSNTSKADDLVCGNIVFENNILFTGTWCFNVANGFDKDNCTIYGSNGTISFGFFGNHVSIAIGDKTEELNFERVAHVQQPMIEKVVAYFLNRAENPCSGSDGVDTMLMIDSFTSGSKTPDTGPH